MGLFHKKTNRSKRRRSVTEQSTTFTRNRTIRGSSLSAIASASEKHSDLLSPRNKAHALARRRRKRAMLLLGVVAMVLFLGFLIYQFTATPVVETNETDSHVDTSLYESQISRYYQIHPAERLRFMLNSDTLAQYIKQTQPEVRSIDAKGAIGLGKTEFSITLRRPVAAWTIDGTTHYVDNRGRAFGKNYFEKPEVSVVDDSGIVVDKASAIASQALLGFIGQVVGQAQKRQLPVASITLPADTTRQVHVKLKDTPYYVKMSIDRSAYHQVEDMAQAVGYFASHTSKTPRYIDVRVERRAFYR